MAAVDAARARGGARWMRDYPPLLAIGAGLLIVLAVLPSSLNLPQTNPTETLEYAPVPPEDQENPPPAGNLSSLGLGRTAGLTDEGPATAPVRNAIKGIVKKATTKRCVGNPPRQTEDPLSPPCVAFFKGDNFGATYSGVTRDEVRILLYVDGNYNDVGSRGVMGRANGRIYDLAKPPEDDENYYVEAARIWQRYFNERFQTYGRFAHFYATFATGQSPEARRSDAAETFNRVKPFAVVVYDQPYESALPFVELMAKRGVLSFGLLSERPESVFRKYAKLEWGYWPSVEQHARQFVDYVCTRVVPFKVSFGGNDSDPDTRLHNGQPRRLGLLSTSDPNHATKQLFTSLARKGIEACGGKFVATGTFPVAGFFCCDTGNVQSGADNMARFKQAGVSTIIWTQGYDPDQSQAAGKIDYRPEWVVASDQIHEDIAPTKYQDASVWDHAVVVANITLTGARQREHCYLAAKEAYPELAIGDSSIPCRLYEHYRQLFTGIQVAGPRLGPTSVDKGYRAIPQRPSGTPTIPACFYLPGDYTCVKDSIAMYWDADAQSRYSGAPGCYRVPQAGKRYLVGTWPRRDVVADRDPSRDPCNGWTSGRFLDPSPGADSPPPQ